MAGATVSTRQAVANRFERRLSHSHHTSEHVRLTHMRTVEEHEVLYDITVWGFDEHDDRALLTIAIIPTAMQTSRMPSLLSVACISLVINLNLFVRNMDMYGIAYRSSEKRI